MKREAPLVSERNGLSALNSLVKIPHDTVYTEPFPNTYPNSLNFWDLWSPNQNFKLVQVQVVSLNHLLAPFSCVSLKYSCSILRLGLIYMKNDFVRQFIFAT